MLADLTFKPSLRTDIDPDGRRPLRAPGELRASRLLCCIALNHRTPNQLVPSSNLSNKSVHNFVPQPNVCSTREEEENPHRTTTTFHPGMKWFCLVPGVRCPVGCSYTCDARCKQLPIRPERLSQNIILPFLFCPYNGIAIWWSLWVVNDHFCFTIFTFSEETIMMVCMKLNKRILTSGEHFESHRIDIYPFHPYRLFGYCTCTWPDCNFDNIWKNCSALIRICDPPLSIRASFYDLDGGKGGGEEEGGEGRREERREKRKIHEKMKEKHDWAKDRH